MRSFQVLDIAKTLGSLLLLVSFGLIPASSDFQNLGGATAFGAPSSAPPLVVGVNVATINNWDGGRPFRNLIYGSSWEMRNTKTYAPNEDVPSTSLDADGWVKAAPEDYEILRALSVPVAGGNFVCRYEGSGRLKVEGTAVRRIRPKPGSMSFELISTYPAPKAPLLSFHVDPSDYIRNIDCREVDAPAGESFAPEFLAALSGFHVIRFMKWQTATEANTAVTWASRNKPSDADFLKNDGVPVELLVEVSNAAGADPWITVPWNADDDYVMRFASYVRDHLKPGFRAYVELSNEVWNGGYPAARQAAAEGEAQHLTSATGFGNGLGLERYAQKTKHVMAIWSAVFRGQTQRLVRVAAFQHISPSIADEMLGYSDLYRSVDALATAPYFGHEISDRMTADEVFGALPDQVAAAVAIGVRQKQVAQKYGLRYITYEAGQHIVLPDNVALQEQVQRDPRMAEVYGVFMRSWATQVGDNLNLFALWGPISKYGAWGLSEYVGQPVADAPKLGAVRGFIHQRPVPLRSIVSR